MKKVSSLQVILTVVYVTALIVANILAGKQFQLPFDIVLGGGILCFPITYILSDVFSEVYGYKWSRLTCWLGFAMTIFATAMFEIAIVIPHPAFWNNQEAYRTVLGNVPRILCGSLLAFLFGDWVNDIVFSKMKKRHSNIKGFTQRALLSSVVGNVFDSMIFVPIAFIGQMPVKTMVVTMVFSAVSKTLYETIFCPVTRMVAKKIYKYESANS